MARLRRAISCNAPADRPIGQIMPKLRIEAPIVAGLRSKTATLRPERAAIYACANPTMPAPTIAMSTFLAFVTLDPFVASVLQCSIACAAPSRSQPLHPAAGTLHGGWQQRRADAHRGRSAFDAAGECSLCH